MARELEKRGTTQVNVIGVHPPAVAIETPAHGGEERLEIGAHEPIEQRAGPGPRCGSHPRSVPQLR